MKNILVAIDREKDADQLIAQAVKLAKISNGKIWLIHVTEGVPEDFLARETGPQYIFDKKTGNKEKEASCINRWVKDLEKEQNVNAEGVVIEGSVTKAIKKIVEEHQIEIVIAGHKKKNMLYELFTSNKKKDLVDELKIPLLAVPLV
ncbi:universal stress protein [Antarcticibacterium arcticum]|uniref:Universal stress protein n=1 Tax=Antarcticibacterium arcticum TaxID=2585771 RepID=A0A5B8YJ88_9FLAO|nr:universal stress protein [Antarcticibacterium arcticum]QED37701.1 universal stress protein [Antarcticibacterium arcticum]